MPWHLVGLALLAIFDPSVLQPGVTTFAPSPVGGGDLRLAPGERRTVFTAEGPGLLREIALARPSPAGSDLRLLMTWDGADQPSVDAPVVDLTGAVDGAPPYSCLLGQVSDETWSFRLPMPFAAGARIDLVNDAATELTTRFSCQWDALSEPPDRGRLHVAWRRETVTAPGSASLLTVQGGAGQIAAVRLSARLTDDIDLLPARLRATLDGQPEGLVSSTWREFFRAEQPSAQPESGLLRADYDQDLRRLDGYRLFPEPVHFEQACRLTLDLPGPELAEPAPPAPPAEQAQLDLTSTVYWYARTARPDGGQPLAADERRRGFRGSAAPIPPKPEELYRRLIGDRDAILGFDSADDWSRVVVRRPGPNTPRWIGSPGRDQGHPHPGRQGIGVLAPPEPGYSARLFWKAMTPPGARLLRYCLSADPHRSPEASEVRFTLSVCDGQRTTQLRTLTLSGRGGPTDQGWLTDASPIGRVGAGVLVILEVAGGGRDPELFIDRLSIE